MRVKSERDVMFATRVRSIAKTILIFFLVVAMVIPQTTWAAPEDTTEGFVQGESTSLQEEDLFNLTIEHEVFGHEDPSQIAFIFVVEFKDGEEYKPYAKQPYMLFADEDDETGEEKVTDEDGKVTLKDTQRIIIPKLSEKDKVKVTEDISGEDFSYVVTSKFNKEEHKEGNEAEEVIGGKDVIVFTNEYVEMLSEIEDEIADQVRNDEPEKEDEIADTPHDDEPEKEDEIADAPHDDEPEKEEDEIADEPRNDETEDDELTTFAAPLSVTPTPTIAPNSTTPNTQATARITTGWIIEGRHTFYRDSKGKIVTGWQKINNRFYYFRPSGAAGVKGRMQTGWKKIGGKLYYLEASGALGVKGRMATGWKAIGNDNFRFDKSGALQAGGWRKISNEWYYLEPKGANGVIGRVATGWRSIGGKHYYFKKTGANGDKGRMFHGLVKIGKHSYFLGGKNDGTVKTGWRTINKKRYYFRTSGKAGKRGRAHIGWHTIGGKTYYFSESDTAPNRGRMATGWRKIGKHRYLFNSSGQPRTGWQKNKNKWFYLRPSGGVGVRGRLQTGWKTIKKKDYYLRASGKLGEIGAMATGFATVGSSRYYFGGANDGAMRTGWQTIKKYRHYFATGGTLNGSKGRMAVGWNTIGKHRHYFYASSGRMAVSVTVDGTWIDKNGRAVAPTPTVVVGGSGQKTIKSLLQNGMKPVGSTLYIWGGGHEAWKKGGDGVRAGVNPNWAKFYNSQSSSYNYNNHRFKHGSGLDCSGYIGWTTYNAIESKSNVFSTGSATTSTSTGMPAKYAGNGWGKVSTGTKAGKFTPGDIVSISGHVWLVVGQCADGSVVIIHSTPNAGVQLAGTPTPGGSSNSQAIQLAQTYMKRYYPNVVNKFKLSSIVSRSYLTPVNRFRWDVSGRQLMSDPEGYLNKTPAQILKDIFNE